MRLWCRQKKKRTVIGGRCYTKIQNLCYEIGNDSYIYILYVFIYSISPPFLSRFNDIESFGSYEALCKWKLKPPTSSFLPNNMENYSMNLWLPNVNTNNYGRNLYMKMICNHTLVYISKKQYIYILLYSHSSLHIYKKIIKTQKQSEMKAATRDNENIIIMISGNEWFGIDHTHHVCMWLCGVRCNNTIYMRYICYMNMVEVVVKWWVYRFVDAHAMCSWVCSAVNVAVLGEWVGSGNEAAWDESWVGTKFDANYVYN